jgi:hypothetical protein
MGEVQDGDPSRFDGYERSVEIQTILEIAEALRKEFGVGIDAHPGGKGNEAGAINRAFRAAIGVLLGEVIPPDELSRAMARMLKEAAQRRLAETDVAGGSAERVLDSEPGLGDRWLAYLLLAPASLIGEIVAM